MTSVWWIGGVIRNGWRRGGVPSNKKRMPHARFVQRNRGAELQSGPIPDSLRFDELMRFQNVGIYGNTVPVVVRFIRAGLRLSRTGLLEAGVGVVLAFWWFQVAKLTINYLQWAAILEFRP